MQPDGVAMQGVPLACPLDVRAMGDDGVGAIYADASGTYGWGAWTAVGSTVYACCGEWSTAEIELDIATLELYASSVGLVTLAPAASACEVYSFTDNTVALAAMRSLSPRAEQMQLLTAARVQWMRAQGVREVAERVTTTANLWADLLSRRGGVAIFEQQVAALGLELQWCEPPAAWATAQTALAAAEAAATAAATAA